jgi:hypothetical protein
MALKTLGGEQPPSRRFRREASNLEERQYDNPEGTKPSTARLKQGTPFWKRRFHWRLEFKILGREIFFEIRGLLRSTLAKMPNSQPTCTLSFGNVRGVKNTRYPHAQGGWTLPSTSQGIARSAETRHHLALPDECPVPSIEKTDSGGLARGHLQKNTRKTI